MAEPADPLPGQWLFPEFEFVRILGRGGSGWVALARDASVGRLVAVKTIYDGGQNSAATERLRREGRILASLRHPGIVTVYQLLSSPGSVSLVMEHLPGGDLRAAIESGAIVGSQAVTALIQVSSALEAATAAGIVHRDVKPANVLLDGNGRAVLADFGLSRLRDRPEEFRTRTGSLTGTPLFMAPERIAHPELETPAGDSYAYGVMAYWLLTGGYPFTAATVPGLLRLQLSQTPRDPADLTAGIPRRTSAALLRALHRDPERRLSPAGLALELTRVGPGTWDRLVSFAHPVRQTAPARRDAPGQETEHPEDTEPNWTVPNPGMPRPARDRIVFPERETWVEPAVYAVPRQRWKWWGPAIGVGIGLLVGFVIFLILQLR